MARAAHPFRIGGPAAASLLVNGLLIAALLDLGMGRVSRREDSPALTVLSLSLLKGVEQGKDEAEAAVTRAVAAVPPAPTEAVAAPTSRQSLSVPPVVVVPSHLSTSAPVAVAAPIPISVATPSQSARQATAVPSAAAAAPAAAARRGAADGLDVTAPPGTSRSYAAKIRSWLYAHKIYPRRARMRREEGQVQVRFVIDRAGMLLEGAVIRRSGVAALDEEAEAMLRRASPYPRAPLDLPGEHMEFTAPIDFILPV